MTELSDFAQKRLRELALRVLHSGTPSFSRFLEPSQETDCRLAAREAGVEVGFWGGYPDAERRIAAFHTGEAPEFSDYPLRCLEVSWNPKYSSPGHRDLLGATLGLGLERDATGDVAMGESEGCAYIFTHADVAGYVLANLESAGRAKLKLKNFEGMPRLRPPEGSFQRLTVASLRLDAILAAALKLSRGEAQRLISAGMVKRNHVEVLRSDIPLQEGDLISVRRYGRLRVESFDGMTRKGRQAVRIFRYGG